MSEQLKLELQSITPDYKPHNDLEKEVKAFASELGFRTSEATYHTVMRPEVIRLLQNRFTPSALYIRSRADRLAIHCVQPVQFEWEAKTHLNAKYNDIALELLPVIFHLEKLRLGIDCLYAYRNPFSKEEKGFWMSGMPTISVVMFPERKEWLILWDWIMGLVNQFLPQIPIKRLTRCGGSQDPFILIKHDQFATMQSWRVLFENTINASDNGYWSF